MKDLIGKPVRVGFHSDKGLYNVITVSTLESVDLDNMDRVASINLKHGKVRSSIVAFPGMIIEEVVK